MTTALGSNGSTWGWRKVRLEVLDRDGYRCQLTRDGQVCGAPATCVDHIVPRALGGSDHPDNLRAACQPCNLRRGDGRRRRPPPASLSLTQHRLVARLDQLGLPADTGRRHALRRLGPTPAVRSGDLDAACAWRRARDPNPDARGVVITEPSRDW